MYNSNEFYFPYWIKHPLLFINGKPQEMISGLEFLERLQSSATTLKMKDRGCNNEKEADNFKALHEAIQNQINDQKELHPTYWFEAKKIVRDGKKEDDKNQTEAQKAEKA